MHSLTLDARLGFRRLVRRPLFSAVAVITLALGVGAATTIFSVIQNVLLDPVPYADSDRVVVVQIHDLMQKRPASRTTFQVAEFLDYREHTTVFEEVVGGGREDVLLATVNGTEAISGGFVTSNTFNFLRVPAALGRGLVPDDGKPHAPSVFVMSYKMWQSRYAGDPAVIGRSFELSGCACRKHRTHCDY